MNALLLVLSKRRRWVVLAAGLLVLAGVGTFTLRMPKAAPKINTAEVKRGEFVENVQVRGELKALRSIVLTAPSGAGDIQIIRLVKNGTQVKKGDVLVQFDTSTLQRTLDQKLSELKTAEGEIERIRAQARLKDEENKTQLTKNTYDVERAKLEVSKQEILAAIEGEKAKIALSDAGHKLQEIGIKLTSDQSSATADVEIQKQKREKATFEVREAERSIAAMSLKAPVDGLVTLMSNWRASSNWGSAPEFKEGDRAWPGAGIVELPDLTSVRVTGRVEETERGRLKTGQTAVVKIDALPAKDFSATLVDISPLAKLDVSTWPPPKNFDSVLQLGETDPKIRPGMSATARIAVERVPNVILIPAEASFQKKGRSVAYVLRGTVFDERVIEITRRSGSQLWIAKGLNPGEKVALKDPTPEEQM
jgi:HlyD family secretion protein